MRRIASAESEPEATKSTLVQRARQRIRRFIFCANRTMWFSACELGVFLATGDSCVKTEQNTKVFSGKGIAMMLECKKLLNHSTAAEGLLLARSSTQRTNATSMDAFLVPKPTDSDADAPSDATEQSALTATMQSTLQSTRKTAMIETMMKMAKLQRMLRMAVLQSTHVKRLLP